MIQMIPGALLSVALTCFGLPGYAVAAGSVGGIVGITLSGAASEQEKTAAIEDEFKINYCCPKCKSFFGYVPWISLANKRTCERCKAILAK